MKEIFSHSTVLADNLPDPVSRFDLDMKFIYVNAEFMRICGKKKQDILGKTSEELFPNEEWTEPWKTMLKRVLETGEADEMETHYKKGFMCTKVVPEFDEKGLIQSLLAIGRDMTAQKKVELELQETKKLLSSILSNTMSSIMVLRSVRKEDVIVDFQYLFVNEEALKSVSRDKLAGKFLLEEFPSVKDSDLFRQYVKVIETGEDYQQELDMSKYGANFWSQIYAHKMETDLLVTYFDVSERKVAEEKLTQQTSLLNQIANLVPDIITVSSLPSRDLLYSNKGNLAAHGFSDEDLINMSVEEKKRLIHADDLPVLRAYFESFTPETTDDEIHTAKYRAYNKEGKMMTFFVRGKVFRRNADASVHSILNVIQNITEKEEAELKILKLKDEVAYHAKEQYRTLFNSMDQGYCIIQMLYENGKAVNWRFLEVNPAFERHNGLMNARGRTIRELTPNIEEKWIEIYDRVAQTGENIRFEEGSDALGRDFDLFAYRIGNPADKKVAVLFTDVTERRRSDRALRESEARLTALVSAVPTAISLIDIEGRIIYSNKEMQHYVPFGKIASTEGGAFENWQAWDQDGGFIDGENFPGARALRGEPVVPGVEMLFTHANGNKTWTRVAAVPVKSPDGRILGTVSVITDIDELKRTAEALIKSSQQLALSLDAAKMGIFEWNSDDKMLRLSPGSIEIYGLRESEAILSNEQAYNLVHFEDIEMRKSVFEQPGVLAAYYHEYRIKRPLDGKMTWIAEKGKAYRDSFTGITTIRGVHWDITEKKKIEEALRSSEKNLKELNENLEQQVQKRTKEVMKLKLNQEKEKLNAIIFTQEQERARISEGLHDGVAQLLYAVQNRLQMLRSDANVEDKELRIAKEILTEAIEDTRKISFELMPPVLKDYGLEVCLKTLIKKIVGERLKLNWDVTIVGRLPEELEITIYRIAQEIINNTLKHAKATEAGLSIKVSDKYVRLKAYDNGIGFLVKKTRKEYRGIGLQSIRNRVKLLNGKMLISSEPHRGTVIELQLPLVQR